MRLRLAALAACAAAAGGHAQTAPPAPPYGIGDALKETQPPRPTPPARPPAPPTVIEGEERAPAAPPGETLQVREIVVEGADLVPAAEVQAELAAYRGRALTLAEIEQAANRVTALYRARGYLLARTYVPQQDARDGRLRLRVVPGSFGRLTLKNRSLVRDATLLSAFAPLQGGTPVTRERLERSMLVVSDMPGAPLPRLTISPGEAPGSSDFEIEVDEGKRLGAYAFVDNQGSRFTGKYRLSAGFDVNSPLGLGDRLSVSAMSSNGADLLNGRLAYGWPLGGSGLRAQLAASKTTYELGGDYADLGATGRALGVEGTLSYPLLRSRDQTVALNASVAERRLRDDVDALGTVNSKKAAVATLAIQHDAWISALGRTGFTSATVSLSYGHLRIEDPTQAALDKAGADTAGRYARLNASLLADIDLAAGWSFTGSVAAQKALGNKNLDPSEQMTISGSNGVKAYRETATGDNAYLLTAGLNYALPAWGGAVQSIGPFAELGHAYLQNGSYTLNDGVRLSDIGVSYKARWRGFVLGLQWAHPVGPRSFEALYGGATRLLAQIGLQY